MGKIQTTTDINKAIRAFGDKKAYAISSKDNKYVVKTARWNWTAKIARKFHALRGLNKEAAYMISNQITLVDVTNETLKGLKRVYTLLEKLGPVQGRLLERQWQEVQEKLKPPETKTPGPEKDAVPVEDNEISLQEVLNNTIGGSEATKAKAQEMVRQAATADYKVEYRSPKPSKQDPAKVDPVWGVEISEGLQREIAELKEAANLVQTLTIDMSTLSAPDSWILLKALLESREIANLEKLNVRNFSAFLSYDSNRLIDNPASIIKGSQSVMTTLEKRVGGDDPLELNMIVREQDRDLGHNSGISFALGQTLQEHITWIPAKPKAPPPKFEF